MSHTALVWAIEQAPVPNPTAAAVLVSLAWHANHEGRDTWPSVERIQLEARLGATAVRAGLAVLESDGLIARDGMGPNGTTRWSLDLGKQRQVLLADELALAQQSRRAADRKRQQKRRQAAANVTPADGVTKSNVTPPDDVTRHGVTPPDDVMSRREAVDVTPPDGPEQSFNWPTTGDTLSPDPWRTADPKAGRPNDQSHADRADGPDANPSPEPDPPPRVPRRDRRHLRAVS